MRQGLTFFSFSSLEKRSEKLEAPQSFFLSLPEPTYIHRYVGREILYPILPYLPKSTCFYIIHKSEVMMRREGSSSYESSSSDDSSSSSTELEQTSAQQPLDFTLGKYWEEWSRCVGSKYQKDQLYRYGRFDTCSRQWKDLKTAGRAKLLQNRDPETARELIASTYFQKRTTISPTAGAIWELKETPGWD